MALYVTSQVVNADGSTTTFYSGCPCCPCSCLSLVQGQSICVEWDITNTLPAWVPDWAKKQTLPYGGGNQWGTVQTVGSPCAGVFYSLGFQRLRAGFGCNPQNVAVPYQVFEYREATGQTSGFSGAAPDGCSYTRAVMAGAADTFGSSPPSVACYADPTCSQGYCLLKWYWRLYDDAANTVSGQTEAVARIRSGDCGTLPASPQQSVAVATAGRSAPQSYTRCQYRPDAPMTAGESAAAGVNPARTYYRCGKPGFQRFGLPVTECQSCGVPPEQQCGPSCPGYAATPPEQEAADDSARDFSDDFSEDFS